MTQQPEFATSKVTPVALVCDTSGSMRGAIDPNDPNSEPRIEGLNRGLKVQSELIRSDRMLSQSAAIGLTTICSPVESFPYQYAAQWQAPTLVASGGTPFGQALSQACDELASFLRELNAAGRPFNRPTFMILSDGAPWGESATDTRDGIERVKSLEKSGKIFLIPAGITDDDCRRLDAMGYQRAAECVSRIEWRELFRIVTASAGSIAHGQRPMP